MTKNIKEVKCKNCGGNNFIYSVYYQSSKNYRVLPNGKLSKKYTVDKDLPEEFATLNCADCGHIIENYYLDKEGEIEVVEI